MKKVLLCGTANLDIVDGEHYFGGAGGGMALNLSRFLEGVGILTVLGDDDFSQKYLAEFKKRKVDISLVMFAKVELSTITVVSSENSEKARIFQDFGVRDIFQALQPDPGKLNNFQWLHVVNTPPRLCDHLAKKFMGFISYCPGSLLMRDMNNLSLPLLKKADFIFCNDEEYRLLQEKVNWEELFQGNLKMVCHTQGKKGLTMHLADRFVRIPRVEVASHVDSTGAGDAVAVGFIKEVVNGHSYEEGLKEGFRLASLVIQQPGVVLP